VIKPKNTVNYIKAQRLSWFGHVQRMSESRTVNKPLTKRSQGRPKYRWEDNTKQDFCQTGQLASRIERNGRRSLRRPKLSAFKESSAPGIRRRYIMYI
jgi:hypothetical protein